jgi:hypothetical protein
VINTTIKKNVAKKLVSILHSFFYASSKIIFFVIIPFCSPPPQISLSLHLIPVPIQVQNVVIKIHTLPFVSVARVEEIVAHLAGGHASHLVHSLQRIRHHAVNLHLSVIEENRIN